jgi:abelson tyrosine-protein kinase 1
LILSDNGDGERSRVRLQNGQTVFLPQNNIAPIESIDKHPWYHGRMSHIRAETILNSGINGSFLVRESQSNAGQLSLCVRFNDRLYHYKIMKNFNGRLYIFDVMMFATLAELVHHHSQHADGLVTTLHYPVPKSEEQSTGGTHEPDEWEIDRDEIRMKWRFNVGHYSDLYLGLWTKHRRKVAVKTLKVTPSTS